MELREVAVQQAAHFYAVSGSSGETNQQLGRSLIDETESIVQNAGSEAVQVGVRMLTSAGVSPHVAETLAARFALK